MNVVAIFATSLSISLVLFVAWLFRKRSPQVRVALYQVAITACLTFTLVSIMPNQWMPRSSGISPVVNQLSQVQWKEGAPDTGVIATSAIFEHSATGPTGVNYVLCYRLGLGVVVAWWITCMLWLRLCLIRSQAASERLQQKSANRVRIVKGLAVPASAGWFKTILLPEAAEQWSDDEIDPVLRHEEAHLARRDHLWFALGWLLSATQWFNPFVWILLNRLRYSQELCADDQVIAGGVEPVGYASLLVNMAKLTQGFAPTVTSTFGERDGMSGRIKRVLNPKAQRAPFAPSKARLLLTATVLLSIFGSVFAFGRFPQEAFSAPGQGYVQSMVGKPDARGIGRLLTKEPGPNQMEILQVSMMDHGKVIAWDSDGNPIPNDKAVPLPIKPDEVPEYYHATMRWREMLVRFKDDRDMRGATLYVIQPNAVLNNSMASGGDINASPKFHGHLLYDKDGWHYFVIGIGLTRFHPDQEPHGLARLNVAFNISFGDWVDNGPIPLLTLPSGKKVEAATEPLKDPIFAVRYQPERYKNVKAWSVVEFYDPDTAAGEEYHFIDFNGKSLDDYYLGDGTWEGQKLHERFYVGVKPEEFKEVRQLLQPSVSGYLDTALSPKE